MSYVEAREKGHRKITISGKMWAIHGSVIYCHKLNSKMVFCVEYLCRGRFGLRVEV